MASHSFFKLKWFPDNQKDVPVQLLFDKVKNIQDFRITYKADKGSLLSGEEYFDLSGEETTCDDSGNRDHEINAVRVEVLSYMNERRQEIYVLKVYPRILKVFRKYNCTIPSSAPAERLFLVGGGIFT